MQQNPGTHVQFIASRDNPTLSAEDLAPLRERGDPLADAFIKELQGHSELLAYCASLPDSDDDSGRHLSRPFRILRFLNTLSDASTACPAPISPGLRDAAHNLWNQASQIPPWLDLSLLRRGQEFFQENAGACFLILLYGSLTGGLSAPWIVPVLKATGYLTGDPSAAVKRLFETTSYVVDCALDTGFPLHGAAWSSSLSVRLLHAQVRLRLQKTPFWTAEDRPKVWGVPINQEDQAVTLLSFSYVVIEGLRTLGLGYSAPAGEAYLHLWRYAGFLMGVDDDANFCGSLQQAHDGLSSLLCHLLRPDDASAEVAAALLRAMTKLPGNWSAQRHATFSRMILGHDLCDALRLPRGGVVDVLVVRAVLAGLLVHRVVQGAVPGARGYLRGRSKAFCKALIRMTLQGPAGFDLTEAHAPKGQQDRSEDVDPAARPPSAHDQLDDRSG